MEISRTTNDDKSITGGGLRKITDNKEVLTGSINPMDIYSNDPQIERENWNCSLGQYENCLITCLIPKIENFSQELSEYNVDIALNGQQFSGFPNIYRFYGILNIVY